MTNSIKNNSKKYTKSLFKESIELLFFLLVLSLVLFLIFNFISIFTVYQQFIITENSMSPVIKKDDIITVNTSFNINDLKVDDIIAFYQDTKNDCKKEVIVRYVAAITYNEQNEKVFLTRYANAPCQNNWDEWQLLECKIIGKYVFNFNMLGKFFMFVKSDLGKSILIYNAIILCFIVKIFKYKKINKRWEQC